MKDNKLARRHARSRIAGILLAALPALLPAPAQSDICGSICGGTRGCDPDHDDADLVGSENYCPDGYLVKGNGTLNLSGAILTDVDCSFTSHSDRCPGSGGNCYDGCSVPDGLLARIGGVAGLVTIVPGLQPAGLTLLALDGIAAWWLLSSDSEAFHQGKDSPASAHAPCYDHDLCYRHGEVTYGFTHGSKHVECDRRFKDNMKARCRSLPWWRLLAKTTCPIARGLAFSAVRVGGHESDSFKQSCCDYLDSPQNVADECEPCGNGFLDPGEDCEPGVGGCSAGQNCRAGCRCTDLPDPDDIPCDENDPGREVGGCCANVRDLFNNSDPPIIVPDGDFSNDTFCWDNLDEGEPGDVVCVGEPVLGGVVGVCEACGDMSRTDKPNGCRCESDEQCQSGTCVGTDTVRDGVQGVCFPEDDSPPWLCIPNCDALFGGSGDFGDPAPEGYCGYDPADPNLYSPDGRARCYPVGCNAVDVFNCPSHMCLPEDTCGIQCEDNQDCNDLGYPGRDDDPDRSLFLCSNARFRCEVFGSPKL